MMNATANAISCAADLSSASCAHTQHAHYSQLSAFSSLAEAFDLHHQSAINVAVHMFSTPLGFVGALGLLRTFTKGSTASLVLCCFYLTLLLPMVPVGVFVGTALLCGLITLVARQVNHSGLALLLIVLGYLLQDLAHIATSETTFQSTYSAGGQIDLLNLRLWAKMFTEHVFYLLPLVVNLVMPRLDGLPAEVRALLDMPAPQTMIQLHTFAYYLTPLLLVAFGSYCIDSKNGFSFFPGSPYFCRVLQCNIAETDEGKVDLRQVRQWALKHMPPTDKSSHWWFGDLDAKEKAAFSRCAHSSVILSTFRQLFGERHYCVDVVEGMNEVYISGPPRENEVFNSDHVFYQRHVDGPWGFIPYVSVYRCIVGMDRNFVYTTHFPIANISNNATEGDVLGFDFNREVHYLSRDESRAKDSDEYRVVLKLHYCVYPRILRPLGWLMHFTNVRYNQVFRALFLKTINPVTLYEHFLAWNVVFNTALFDFVETFFGQRSLYYLLFAASLWYVTGSYEVFFVLTSFVHYIRYISTYYFRTGIDFGSFKRDVLLFKTLAVSQLVYLYLFPTEGSFQLDWVSLAMIASGYTVSLMATSALGVDRTYFAAELGLVEPKWITQFPYGYIPHPMIVSQIWALAGFYKAAHFRAISPFVVPGHITLYLLHMLQEHLDIYARPSHMP